MRLTRFTDYSLRVLIYLGLRHGTETLVTIRELADAYRVSRHHLRAVHTLADIIQQRTMLARDLRMALA